MCVVSKQAATFGAGKKKKKIGSGESAKNCSSWSSHLCPKFPTLKSPTWLQEKVFTAMYKNQHCVNLDIINA